MSVFDELLPKIKEISNAYTKNYNDDLKAAFEIFDQFEEELRNGQAKAQDTLQSIHEDEDEQIETSDSDSSTKQRSSVISLASSTESEKRRVSKQSKHEVDSMSSPEQDKRGKRTASAKAQSIISKQVKVNLTQKLRDDGDKTQPRRRNKEVNKEIDPIPVNIQIKQEKISLPAEPESMGTESLPVNIEVKKEVKEDMPPPAAPVPMSTSRSTRASSRSTRARSRSTRQLEQEDPPAMPEGRPKRTRAKKKVSDAPLIESEKDQTQPSTENVIVSSSRSTRASSRSSRARSRSTRQLEQEDPPAMPEVRPKRTRAKKKDSDVVFIESEKEQTQPPMENVIASPPKKPRPKRTCRGQKAAEKPEEVPKEREKAPKEERISHTPSSPILQKVIPKKTEKNNNLIAQEISANIDEFDKTRAIPQQDMDQTVVLPHGVFNHAPFTPKSIRNINETVVIEAASQDTIVLNKPIMNTVVLEKDPIRTNLTDDSSLLTDDSDVLEMHTPPKQELPTTSQPPSAVKEKVQQFEELASRVTRTKTRAMAKKVEPEDSHTPSVQIVKPVLSAKTLNKMNNMIFKGKPPQISSSASKPQHTVVPMKSCLPASTSKQRFINETREKESLKKNKEDARKKKEALLEAKKELQKRKREEKMAAAAAARQAAERERRLAMLAVERERRDKQVHTDQGKLERLREAERKKADLARKVAVTEERRRAEKQRLAEEQRKAEEARRKQMEEAAATKKEAAIMAKEIEKRQREYIEKQKMIQRIEDKLIEPVYMADGFQYLNSDEDEEPVERPAPVWSTAKNRRRQLVIQGKISRPYVDRLYSVRVHSPDLSELFPHIERARLKRTSSAVWCTPPSRLPVLTE